MAAHVLINSQGAITTDGSGRHIVSGDMDFTGSVYISGSTVIDGSLTANGGITFAAISATGSIVGTSGGTITGSFNVTGSVSVTGSLSTSGSILFGSTPTLTALTSSTNLSFDRGGMYVLSSSTGAVTATVPDPGRVPGARYIFRAGSAHAHVVTGSVAGFKSFCHTSTPAVPAVVDQGSKLTMDAVQNVSVILDSDGFHYIVTAASGTAVLSAT